MEKEMEKQGDEGKSAADGKSEEEGGKSGGLFDERSPKRSAKKAG